MEELLRTSIAMDGAHLPRLWYHIVISVCECIRYVLSFVASAKPTRSSRTYHCLIILDGSMHYHCSVYCKSGCAVLCCWRVLIALHVCDVASTPGTFRHFL